MEMVMMGDAAEFEEWRVGGGAGGLRGSKLMSG